MLLHPSLQSKVSNEHIQTSKMKTTFNFNNLHGLTSCTIRAYQFFSEKVFLAFALADLK